MPPACWPLDFYIEIQCQHAQAVLTRLEPELGRSIFLRDESRQYMEENATQGIGADLELSVMNSKTLGKVIVCLRESGIISWSDWDETYEVVLRNPVHGELLIMQTKGPDKSPREETGG